jgi:AraC-like DNA-binding protein
VHELPACDGAYLRDPPMPQLRGECLAAEDYIEKNYMPVIVEVLRRYSNQENLVIHLKKLAQIIPGDQPLLPLPRQRQTRLDPEAIALLATEYEAGASVYDLAKRFNVDRSTVSDHLRTMGIATRYRILSTQQIEEAAVLYQGGWSLARLGDRFGVSANTMLNAFRRSGVATRARIGRDSKNHS